MNIGVLGAGSWAISLSVLLNKRNHNVCMWEFNSDDATMLIQKREHAVKLPGVIIPENITITNDIAEIFTSADYILCAIPAQTVRSTVKLIAETVDPPRISSIKAWIIASKGIECSTLSLLSDVIRDELPDVSYDKIVILSGPSHAEEVSRNIPTNAGQPRCKSFFTFQTPYVSTGYREYFLCSVLCQVSVGEHRIGQCHHRAVIALIESTEALQMAILCCFD